MLYKSINEERRQASWINRTKHEDDHDNDPDNFDEKNSRMQESVGSVKLCSVVLKQK